MMNHHKILPLFLGLSAFSHGVFATNGNLKENDPKIQKKSFIEENINDPSKQKINIKQDQNISTKNDENNFEKNKLKFKNSVNQKKEKENLKGQNFKSGFQEKFENKESKSSWLVEKMQKNPITTGILGAVLVCSVGYGAYSYSSSAPQEAPKKGTEEEDETEYDA